MNRQKKVLITGSSGFLGRALLRRFLETSDDKFYLLMRNTKRSADLQERLGLHERICPVEGDITQPWCGMSLSDYQHVTNDIDEIWHSAASTEFEEARRPEITRVNCEGTTNMLVLARECKHLDDFFYVSTAYVFGKRNRPVPESDFEPHLYKNPYEETKMACERKVRDAGVPFTIVRPSILIGNSKTLDPEGETRMIYGYCTGFYLAMVRKLGGQQGFWEWHKSGEYFDAKGARIRAKPTTTLNTITIDDAANVFDAIRNYPGRKQMTYNVVNPVPVQMSWLMETMKQCLHLDNVRLDPNLSKDEVEPRSFEGTAWKSQERYFPYFQVPEPPWQRDGTAEIVPDSQRVIMTRGLFYGLMETFFNGLREKNYAHKKASAVALDVGMNVGA